MENYKIPDNLAVSEEGFLFLPATGESFTLNEIGKIVIGLLKNGSSIEEIIERLTEEFDVDEHTAEKDVNDFLTQLKNFRLVEEI
ncbi:MAG: PqqD family protein [Chlorobi bacterium]|nr:PqqD family protein [Chlorobiota bacterium]